jgi:Ca2+-binding EF-hand superfamily protein
MTKYSLTALTALILGSGLALAGTALAGGDCGGKGGAGKGGEQRMNHLDANKDGKVTLTELTQVRESWLTEVDANKDGVVTQAEVDANRKTAHAERIAQMFARKDANKDGRLTKEESGMPEARFARIDANKDGALTREEFDKKPEHQGKPGADGAHAERGRGMFLHLDVNQDGKIDREEVRKAAADMLKRLDKNGDGALSADELHGMGHQGRHRHGPHGGAGETDGAKTPQAT